MNSLSKDHIRAIRKLRNEHGFGHNLSQSQMDDLVAQWSPIVSPDEKDWSERFTIVWFDGSETGVYGPRWIFHLFGFSHRASHVGLTTSSGLVVLQKRSLTKADWPGCWDMTVSGHVPVSDDNRSLNYRDGAIKEIGEEIGLTSEDMELYLTDGLQEIGIPYLFFEMDETRNPPFYNAEIQQLFGGCLTQAGLQKISPDFDELDGIMLVREEIAWSLLTGQHAAAGLRSSLPRFLDWLHQKEV